jgi:hypothetical protein
VVQVILEQSEGPMTRRAILRLWPDRTTRPAALTLWRWLGRAVQEGRVLQDGRGNRKHPFRYRLPGMAPKWHQDFLARLEKELELYNQSRGPDGAETPGSGDGVGTAAEPTAVAAEAMRCLASVPPAEPEPPTAAPELPQPDLLPSQPCQPLEPPPEAPVRLPYPYNTMNPADVPEEVWRRAREARQNE